MIGLDAILGIGDKLIDRLIPDPAQKAEAQLKLAELAQNGELKEFELEVQDRDSARKMQIAALEQDDIFSKRFVLYLAAFWSISAVAYIGFVTFGHIPGENTRFADTILGFLLGTVVGTILNFFFGSSKSSKDKTDALVKASK